MSLWLAQHVGLGAADEGKRLKTPLRGSFLSLGAGMGSIATSDADDDSGIAIAARLGQSLSPDIHLVEQVVIKVGSANREVATSYSFLAVGVRWTPFHGSWEFDPGPLRVSRFVDPAGLYLEAAAGVGLRERTIYDGT